MKLHVQHLYCARRTVTGRGNRNLTPPSCMLKNATLFIPQKNATSQPLEAMSLRCWAAFFYYPRSIIKFLVSAAQGSALFFSIRRIGSPPIVLMLLEIGT